MDYSHILQELNKASLFDLNRLRSAIYHELLNPNRIAQIKAQIKVGQHISYFDHQSNDLVEADILEINKTRCLVRNLADQQKWHIPFYSLNLENVDTDIQPPRNAIGIPKQSLKIGSIVGFLDKNHNELFGEVIRLNPKRATIRISGKSEWLVPYSQLFPVIEGEAAEAELKKQLELFD